MNKELKKRGLDQSLFVNLVRIMLFLFFTILHVYLNRLESYWSWILPIPSGLIFAGACFGFDGIGKPWTWETDQEGVRAVNGFKVCWLMMAVALYVIGFLDRG
jgi:hypothetical protein